VWPGVYPPPDPQHIAQNSLPATAAAIAPYRTPERLPETRVPIERPAELARHKDKSKEIMQCATLLREMFALDLMIWAAQDATRQLDKEARRAMERQADNMLGEVRTIVKRWQEQPDIEWTPNEQELVDRVMSEIYSRAERRYT